MDKEELLQLIYTQATSDVRQLLSPAIDRDHPVQKAIEDFQQYGSPYNNQPEEARKVIALITELGGTEMDEVLEKGKAITIIIRKIDEQMTGLENSEVSVSRPYANWLSQLDTCINAIPGVTAAMTAAREGYEKRCKELPRPASEQDFKNLLVAQDILQLRYSYESRIINTSYYLNCAKKGLAWAQELSIELGR